MLLQQNLQTESFKSEKNMSLRQLSTIAFLYNKQYGQSWKKEKSFDFLGGIYKQTKNNAWIVEAPFFPSHDG